MFLFMLQPEDGPMVNVGGKKILNIICFSNYVICGIN